VLESVKIPLSLLTFGGVEVVDELSVVSGFIELMCCFTYSFSSSISHITVPFGSGHWIVFVFGSQSLSSTMFLCFAGISGSMLASA